MCLGMASAYADIAVIVNAANPVQSMTNRQVAELYLGRSRTFESGQVAAVMDAASEDPIRAQFFKGISGMSMGQVTAYWSRLKFTGQVQPPKSMGSEAAMLNEVRQNEAAIGFVSTLKTNEPKVKTVLILRE